jgi:type II secretory pathway pseudopilin PulG
MRSPGCRLDQRVRQKTMGKICPHRLGRASFSARAFSLTEVVIAMGVAAVAFTSIIGLFPVGLNMSKESYESVQSALLAQTILADIRDQQTGNGNLRGKKPYESKLIQVGANSDPIGLSGLSNYLAVKMTTTNQLFVYVAYNQLPRNNSDTDPAKGVMLRPCGFSTNSNPPTWYLSGSNGCVALAKITLAPTLRYTTVSSTSTPIRVDIAVETPGNVGVSNRATYLYTGTARP